MKFMNNHFGQSRIFGNARCRLPFEITPFMDADVGGGSGGGSSSGTSDAGTDTSSDGTGTDGNSNNSGAPSIEELMTQLSAERARAAKLQNEKDRASSEAAGYKKQLREKMTSDEQTEAAKAEALEAMQKELAELRLERQISGYVEKCMDKEIGMNKDTAKTFAESLAKGDIDKAFDMLGKHIKSTKSAWEQEFYASHKDFSAGNGDGKENLALQKAKSLPQSGNRSMNTDALKNYI